MIRVGILGAAGYTGGELIRLLLNHPDATIAFAHSESNAGCAVADVHEGLTGETEMRFSADMPFEQADVVFFCFGHGKSEQFLREHEIPGGVKIIDMAQDFRVERLSPSVKGRTWVYGLPELNRDEIRRASSVANPGCFATCIELGLLPAARQGLLTSDVTVSGVTGSTGAGQKPQATTHFSWREGNMSVYKLLTHQHLHEICQSLNQVRPQDSLPVGSPIDRVEGGVEIDFIPWRGDFARGIFVNSIVRLPDDTDTETVVAAYRDYYRDAAFTHYTDRSLDLKQVVNTNKCLVHADVVAGKLVVSTCIDNLLKGAVGQAVQNMNLMFGLDERSGLRLKASAF